jgi:N-acetylglucosamine-6-sulfatase
MRTCFLAALAAVTPLFVAAKPNILLILADDQDMQMGSLQYQSVVQRELIDKGRLFKNHYTTTSQCCPSRASLLRGQQSHNTNITNVVAPG